MYFPPGFSGAVIGLLITPLLTLCIYWRNSKGSFLYDHKGVPGAFEPFLAKYIRATEFVVGISTGSIVLLVGSSALHGQGGHLPWFYASPLLLLAWSVVWAIAFMIWIIDNYSRYRHGFTHTPLEYSTTLSLGYGAVICFGVGYVWLIYMVTK